MEKCEVPEIPKLDINYRGLRSQIPGIIDDSCDVGFEPECIIDSDEKIKNNCVSLVKNPEK